MTNIFLYVITLKNKMNEKLEKIENNIQEKLIKIEKQNNYIINLRIMG